MGGSFVKIGDGLTTPKEHDKSPSVSRSESGDIVTRKYNINKANVKSYTDALVYGTADAVYTNAYLSTIQIEAINGGTSEITLTYAPQTLSYEVLPAVGTVTQEIDSNAIDIPIKKNPNLSPSEMDDNIDDGVDAYLSPQPIYRRTEILSSFSFDEAGGSGSIQDVLDTVGKIDTTPEDLSNPSAEKWLKVGFVVRSVGDKFEKVEVWQYASNGWDTNIYDTIA